MEALVLVVLFAFHADVHDLEDVVVGAQFQVAHVDLGVVTQEVLRELPHLLRPGSAPHQCLPVRLERKGRLSLG